MQKEVNTTETSLVEINEYKNSSLLNQYNFEYTMRAICDKLISNYDEYSLLSFDGQEYVRQRIADCYKMALESSNGNPDLEDVMFYVVDYNYGVMEIITEYDYSYHLRSQESTSMSYANDVDLDGDDAFDELLQLWQEDLDSYYVNDCLDTVFLVLNELNLYVRLEPGTYCADCYFSCKINDDFDDLDIEFTLNDSQNYLFPEFFCYQMKDEISNFFIEEDPHRMLKMIGFVPKEKDVKP